MSTRPVLHVFSYYSFRSIATQTPSPALRGGSLKRKPSRTLRRRRQVQSSSPALRGGSSKMEDVPSFIRVRSSSSPALRGGSSKPTPSPFTAPRMSSGHHPLRCGAVLRSDDGPPRDLCRRREVIIPCVAGRFFEGYRRCPDLGYHVRESSSPALRGGSSKRVC